MFCTLPSPNYETNVLLPGWQTTSPRPKPFWVPKAWRCVAEKKRPHLGSARTVAKRQNAASLATPTLGERTNIRPRKPIRLRGGRTASCCSRRQIRRRFSGGGKRGGAERSPGDREHEPVASSRVQVKGGGGRGVTDAWLSGSDSYDSIFA